MSLLPFFTWCEKSAIGEAIRNSQWLFPVIESVHLLALVLIAGAVLVVVAAAVLLGPVMMKLGLLFGGGVCSGGT